MDEANLKTKQTQKHERLDYCPPLPPSFAPLCCTQMCAHEGVQAGAAHATQHLIQGEAMVSLYLQTVWCVSPAWQL
jgi:hypothetical protein